MLANGVPSSDMLDAVADGRPFSSVSVTDLRVIESALAERVQMASCNFWQFPTTNLQDKIQLALLDPPYGTRLERGEPNSAHDRLSERDMQQVAVDVTGMVRRGGQLVIHCSDLQFSKCFEILSNLRTTTSVQGRGVPEWNFDPCSMVAVSSKGGGGDRSSTALANWVDKSNANNVRIEPLPNYLRVPRKQTCSCLIGCRTGVEPFRTHADRGHVLVKK